MVDHLEGWGSHGLVLRSSSRTTADSLLSPSFADPVPSVPTSVRGLLASLSRLFSRAVLRICRICLPRLQVNRGTRPFGRYKNPRRPHPPPRASRVSHHPPQVSGLTLAHSCSPTLTLAYHRPLDQSTPAARVHFWALVSAAVMGSHGGVVSGLQRVGW